MDFTATAKLKLNQVKERYTCNPSGESPSERSIFIVKISNVNFVNREDVKTLLLTQFNLQKNPTFRKKSETMSVEFIDIWEAFRCRNFFYGLQIHPLKGQPEPSIPFKALDAQLSERRICSTGPSPATAKMTEAVKTKEMKMEIPWPWVKLKTEQE